MLDLRTIPLADLKALILVCDVMAKRGNSYFADQFVILSRVALSHHEIKEMAEYPTEELVEAVDHLKLAIEGNAALPDDHLGKTYLRYALTAAVGELERRARRENIKAVH